MSDVVLRPSSIDDLISSLENIKGIGILRSTYGWPLFMADEEWKYTATFENTCDTCIDFHNGGPYRGPDIPHKFPQWVRTDKFEIWPRVHQDLRFPFLFGDCRCRVTLMNPLQTIKDRLIREIEASL